MEIPQPTPKHWAMTICQMCGIWTQRNRKCHLCETPIPDMAIGKEIVVLCGSTRFYLLYDEMNLKFTLEGKIVLSIGTVHQGDHGSVFEDKKVMLDELHKRKIDLADWVFVINKDGYIGESTRSEIDYARSMGKQIRYLE